MHDSQRLFRLTSQSNDGVFDTLMNEDIEIKAGSSLALQSCSFDRQSTQVKVDSSNKYIAFGLLKPGVISSGTEPIIDWVTQIPLGTYSQVVDADTLMEGIEHRMNACISMDRNVNVANPLKRNVVTGGFEYSINKGSQWKVGLNQDGKTEIECRTQAPCQISNLEWSKTSAALDTTVYAGSTPPTLTADGTAGDLDFMMRPTGGAGAMGDYNDSYVWGKVRMTKGTGCIRARIAEMAPDTNDDVYFTVGLVLDKTVLEQGTIADQHIHYGVQCMGAGSAYRSKVGTVGTWTNLTRYGGGGAMVPVQFTRQTDGDNENDVVEIRLDGGDPTIGRNPTTRCQPNIQVHTQGYVSVTEIPEIAQSADWYYFISFHRPGADIKLDMCEADLDPYEFVQVPGSGGDSIELFPVQRSMIPSVVRSGLASPDYASPAIPYSDRQASFRFTGEGVNSFFNYPTLSLPTVDGSSFFLSSDYRLTAPKRAEFGVGAKKYIILFDNVPISSYDTYSRFDSVARNANSGGSRRNILATIPVKEDLIAGSSVTRVAYEPNSLNFIDLANRQDMLTRSLRCRILTSTYDPVEIDGMASLTVLLKTMGC